MNQDQQIDRLNTILKVTLAPSKIHGVGVFAIRDILQGERLYLDQYPQPFNVPYSSFGKLFPEVRQLILEHWPSVVNGQLFAQPDTRHLCYMNHSLHPNYSRLTDTAREDIKCGEEITEDYWSMENAEKVFPWLKDNMSTHP